MFLSFDIGTTRCKTAVFDTECKLLASSSHGYETYHPRPDWAEQEPDDWWAACVRGARECAAQTDLTAIRAVGLSSQREGVVAISHTGRPLARCIIWMDRRATEESEELANQFGREAIYQRTGLPLDPTWTAVRILWLKRNRPGLLKKARCLLQPKDYIAYKLTGVLATDHSLASRTLMFDVRGLSWWQEMFDFLDISPDIFPPLFNSFQVIGEVSREVADRLGIPPGIPVVAGAGDRACEVLGAGVWGDKLMESTGSTTNMSKPLKAPILDPGLRLACSCWALPKRWLLEAGMSTSGAIITWLANMLGCRPRDLFKLASESELGARGLWVYPFFMGARAPRWNPRVRGAFTGLSLGTTRADMARAVLEGIGYEMRYCLEVIESLTRVSQIHSVGGAARDDFWSQLKADMLNKKVVVPAVAEAASLGAALLAGLGIREYKSVDKLPIKMERVFKPRPAVHAKYLALYSHYKRRSKLLESAFA